MFNKDTTKTFFLPLLLLLSQPISCLGKLKDTASHSNVNSLISPQDFSKGGNEPDAMLLTHEDCSNFTPGEVNVIVSYYPDVKVLCQALGTTLIPIYSDDFENIPPPRPPTSKLDPFKSQKKFLFNEIGLVSETDATRFAMPVSPCARVSGDAKGVSEVEFSLRAMATSIIKFTRLIRVFSLLVAVRTTWLPSLQFAYSTVCHFTHHPVRHMAEVSTVVTNERIRVVTMSPNQDPVIQYGDWSSVGRVRIMENTLLFSCVSEEQVPGVCGWTDEQVVKRLSTQARKKGAKSVF